jgi:general secretion pathway protein D
MIANRAFARLGAALCVLSMLSGCASFPAMSVSTANDASSGPRNEPSRSGAIPRPQSQVTQIPRLQAAGPGRAQIPEASPAQIAEIVPDEPVGATVPPQALPQFLNAVFADVLKVPYSLGPNVALRTEVLSINAPPTLSKRAYVQVLGTALRSYGLTLSAQGRGFTITEEGGPGGALPAVIRSRSSADTPLGARSVTQYFQLVALQADAVQKLVQDMVGLQRATISVDSAANALVLTGTGRGVAQAVDILRNLDQPAFAGAQVIRLEPVFWSADTFATALQNALAAEGYVVSTDPLGPKSILILPMTATNQTLAFAADTATMERVRYWARELDQPSALGDQNTTFVYEVRNTSAAAIGQMLISAGGSQARLTGVGPGGAAAVVQALGGAAGVQALQGGRGGGGGQNRGIQAQQLQGGGGRGGGVQQGIGQNRGGVGVNGNANQNATLAPFGGAVPGGGAITVDDAGNRILFTGTATQFAQLRNLLQQLDAPARQVRVEVTVAEVTLTDETRVGLEWFFNGVKNGDGFAGGTQSNTGVSGLGIGNTGINLGFIRTDAAGNLDFRASFNAFASNNKVNILSQPSLTTRSGSPGAIQVGADVPYIQQQRAANTGTTTNLDVIQTVSYRQTGVIMQITPVVYGDDRVDLNIYQEVSADRINPNRDITSPIFDTRVVTTTLSLADGETAVLGGLIEDSYSKDNSGIPFLKDLPVVGQAFRTDSVSGRKTELVVLLTPFIIHDSREMRSVSNQVTDQINRAFRVGKGGSYTLTPWGAGLSVGINPPDPKVRQGYARPEPSPVATPASPANAEPATVPPAPSPPAPAGAPEPSAPPPSAPTSSPPARR